ncbi:MULTISPECIES: hypothetical protein [Myroides]|uniref:Uncharacterized protein n=1 Tax=Myroides albus TaxID=2562892 RepID=A0A6I3LIG4_9FLAO|nr:MULTISPECIES: hypothetical protein [Myroides]MTG99419.1 hypothetical protein [Myroides albus]MVX37327.1 hypothetical protein [Myroides sp. LoEW2-1]UVD78686.1 hypothetical protein NWE55_11200 [Myroides albus]
MTLITTQTSLFTPMPLEIAGIATLTDIKLVLNISFAIVFCIITYRLLRDILFYKVPFRQAIQKRIAPIFTVTLLYLIVQILIYIN